MTDEEIDLSEMPELTEQQLRQMKPLRQVLAERRIPYKATGLTTVVIQHSDGKSSAHQLAPQSNIVVLDPDVQRFFPDSITVNRILRSLIDLIPQTQ